MKLLLFAFFLALSYLLPAQETNLREHAVSMSVGPGTSLWIGQAALGGGTTVLNLHYRLAASYHHRLAPKWWLRAGIEYTELQLEERFVGNDPAPVLEYPYVEYSVQTNQSVIAVPLALRGYLFPRWYAEIEASANLLPDEEELDQLNIGLGFAFGWQYSFGADAGVFAQPMARWLVNPGEDSVFGRAQRDKLSVGLDLGFRKEI